MVRGWLLVVLGGMLLTGAGVGSAAAGDEPHSSTGLRTLTVKSESAGGVRADAVLLFPGSPTVIQSILTDYARWPELFETQMRMARIEVQDGHVLTDVYISHALLPGEQRLLCESTMLPTGGLVTELKGGDFKRYHRVWKLQPVGDGRQTRAEFEMAVEVKALIPDWLVAVSMERELNAHFHKVRARALDLVTQEK